MSALDSLLSGADHEAIEITLATVLANRMGGDAVAVFLVAPASSGKTELVLACRELADCEWLSTVTPKTLASGLSTKVTGGNETSLLLKLKSAGKTTLLLKEFGSVLAMNSKERQEVIGQLREVLDGQYHKAHGSGRDVLWEGTLGMLAAVTGEIEEHWATVRKLGDRWVFVRVRGSEYRLDVAMAAIEGTAEDGSKRKRLSAAVKALMALIGDPSLGEVVCEEGHRRQIAVCANYLARVRTPVSRTFDKEVRSIPEPEGPARLAKSLYRIAAALAVLRGRRAVGPADIATIVRIVEDTMPSVRRRVLGVLGDGPLPIEALARSIRLPSASLRLCLEDLEMLGIVTSHKESKTLAGRPAELWSRNGADAELLPYWQLRTVVAG
jgi:hypothetical protein